VRILDELVRQSVRYPIVVITGCYVAADSETAARRLGAIDFRRKPLDVDDMDACLRAAISAFRASGAGLAASAQAAFVPLRTGLARTSIADEQAHDLNRLHARTRLGEDDAREQLLVRALPELERRLQLRFRRASRDLVVNAVEDALLDYMSDPGRFDMTRDVPLGAFILRAASRNLINSLASERRRHDREGRYASDAAAMMARYEPSDGPDLSKITLSPDDVSSDGAERQAFELWRGGERRTEAFARVLGLADRSPVVQAREVKRFKDRLIKRIRRLFDSPPGTRSR
jgi:hypothetical protein